jgi:transposase-like protein
MSEKIVQLKEEVIKEQIKKLVRGSVEETLNGLLGAEAKKLTQAAKYERSEDRQGYRNVFSVVPKSKFKLVVKMLKAIHAQESKKATREKAKAVVAELQGLNLKEAAKKVEDGIEETLTYADFPSEHWTRIRTNNVIERLNREIRRRTWWAASLTGTRHSCWSVHACGMSRVHNGAAKST